MKKSLVFLGLLLLALNVMAQTSDTEKRIDYISAFPICIQQNAIEITDSLIVQFAMDFRNDIYKKYRNDEFEWQDQKQKIKKEIEQLVLSTSTTGNYVMATGIEFGNYDFEKLGFNVSIGEGTYFPFYASGRYNSNLPQISLVFVDFTKYNFFPVAKDKANEFLKSRKDSYGNVDRKITLLIHYTIVPASSDDFKKIVPIFSSGQNYVLVGKISKIDVYNKTTLLSELIIK